MMPAPLMKRDWSQIISDGEMECSECGATKPLDEMRKRLPTKEGRPRWGPNCNECNAAAARQWNRDNRERATQRQFERNLRTLYDMSAEAYGFLLDAQDGGCAICGGVNPLHGKHGTRFRLSVDHNHDTGEVRGLLCNNCNRALGLFGDDLELLQRAVAYLKGDPN